MFLVSLLNSLFIDLSSPYIAYHSTSSYKYLIQKLFFNVVMVFLFQSIPFRPIYLSLPLSFSFSHSLFLCLPHILKNLLAEQIHKFCATTGVQKPTTESAQLTLCHYKYLLQYDFKYVCLIAVAVIQKRIILFNSRCISRKM